MKNLLELINFGFNLVDAIKEAKANDGKVDFKDWPLLFPLIGEGGLAVEEIEKIVSEWKNGSAEQRAEVVALVKTRFDLENDILEEKIEKVLDIAVLVIELAL